MKKFCLIIVVLSFSFNLFAQKDTAFYKHEVKVSVSDGLCASFLSSLFDTGQTADAWVFANVSVGYFYRPVKWLWVGGNFINYFGERIYLHKWREYYTDGSVKDFSISKIKYCAAIAPEVRFSYKNTQETILYSALSGGIWFEDGYKNNYYNPPTVNYYFHATLFGFNSNFGKNQNIFLGGEIGFGFKGLFNIHGGYRF